MTKNYIFDFGKVLVEFEPAYMTGQYITDAEDIKLVSETLFDRFYWDKLDDGTIRNEDFLTAVNERLPERLHGDVENIYRNWYRHLPLIKGMKEILLRLKTEGHSLYLLSNISCYFAENYAKVPALKELFELFDGLVFSGPIGMVKPNAEIYQYLLDKYELQAEECTFIDDSVMNIEGAKRMGIQTILFEGSAEELEKRIF